MVPGGGSMNRISRSRGPSNISHPHVHRTTTEYLGSRPPSANSVSSNITELAFCSLQENMNRYSTPGIVVSVPDTEQPHIASRINTSASTWNFQNSTLSSNGIILPPCSAVNATKDISSGAEGKRICEHNSRTLNPYSRTLTPLRDLILMQSKPSMLLRLKLAVLLASSVMQLHGTGWLRECWSSEDIFFEGVGNNFELDQPLVRGMFNIPHDADTPMEDANGDGEVSAVILFATRELFSLGIVLLELHHWKPWNELQGRRAEDTGTALVNLVDGLGEQAGLNYQSAVQRCIQGLGYQGRKLEHEDFTKEAYEKVVAVLEADLKYFCQENDLQKIFQDSAKY